LSIQVRNVFVMGNGGVTSPITLQHNDFMSGAVGVKAANQKVHT